MVFSAIQTVGALPTDVIYETGQGEKAQDADLLSIDPGVGKIVYLVTLKMTHNRDNISSLNIRNAGAVLARVDLALGGCLDWNFYPSGLPFGSAADVIYVRNVTAAAVYFSWLVGYRIV